MRKPSVGITAEGVPSIAFSAFASLIFAILGCSAVSIVFLFLAFFCGHFFRDPERVIPQGKGIAVCPADGKVIKIEQMPDPFSGEKRQCICIFMNVFNVHVNRSPVAGTVSAIAYHEGLFFNASLDKASKDNERCAYAVTDEDGRSWSMVQIAGLIARRIVCRVEEGEKMARGERFGLIKFGSRVDVYLPEGYSPAVAVGEAVMAGSTVIARSIDA